MQHISADLRRALRALWRSPQYTIAAVLTLALGVGTLTLAAAFANAFYFRPMPFRADHELVGISMTHRIASGELLDYAVSINDYVALRERQQTLTDIGAINQQTYVVQVGDEPESVRGGRVSASMWSVLGTTPVAGRTYGADEDVGTALIAVVSAALQHRLYPGPPSSAIGKAIVLDGIARTIVGVMPRGFRPRMNPGDVWIPLGAAASSATQADSRQLQTVGRMRPGMTLDQTADDMNSIARALETERPSTNREWGASTKDLRAKVGDRARGISAALVAAVAFMLLLTCANTANLSIARLVRRRTDIATHMALGASATTMVRHYVLEVAAISCAGGAIGLGLATAILPFAVASLTSDNPLLSLVSVDWRVVMIAAGASIVAGATSATAPALLGVRLMSGRALERAARRVYAGVGDQRIRRALMTVQVAAAAVLLAGTLAAVQALNELMRADVGYDPSRLVMATVTLPVGQYPGVRERSAFVTQVNDHLRATPGVTQASATTGQFLRDARIQGMFRLEDDISPGEGTLAAELRRITPEYFDALDIPIERGRAFVSFDRDSSPPVAIVNHSFVEKYLGGRDPLTTRIRRGSFPPVDIVGVVPDSRDGGASENSGPTVYYPFAQSAAARVTFVIATDLASREAEQALRSAIREVDHGRPLDRVAPMSRMLHESLGEERFKTIVLGVMTCLAVLIAGVGIYGVTAYLLQQGARDVAIKLALGATRSRVLAQLVGGTMVWISIGVVAGIVASRVLGAQFASRLPELSLPDPAAYFIVAIALWAIGCVATALPSLRASRASPAGVLRGD